MPTADLGNIGRLFTSFEAERKALEEAEKERNEKLGTPGLVRPVSDLDPFADVKTPARFLMQGPQTKNLETVLHEPPQNIGQGQQAPPRTVGQPNIAQPIHRPSTAGERAQAAIAGVTVGQLRLAQTQAMMAQFELQQAVRMQQAQQNIPTFTRKAEKLKPFLKAVFDEEKKRAVAMGEEPPTRPTLTMLERATQQYDEVNKSNPFTNTDQDTLMFTEFGKQFMLEKGILPFDVLKEVTVHGEKELAQERAKFQGEMMRAVTSQDIAGLPLSQQAALMDVVPGLQPQFRQVPGQAPVPQPALGSPNIGETVQAGFGGDSMPAEVIQAEGVANPGQRIPPVTQFTGINPQQPLSPAARLLATQAMKGGIEAQTAGATARATLPAEIAIQREKEEAALRLESQKAAERDRLATQKSEDNIRKIERQHELTKDLESFKASNKQTYRKLDAELNNERDRAKGRERMQELQFKIENRPESTALSLEDKKALVLLNGALAGSRVDANNAAKAARQLAALTQEDEKTVLSAMIKSGAVKAQDMMEAAKRADQEAKLNPEKKGSLTHAVFTALQDIHAERSIDPFTDDIDFALTARGKPEKISELTRLINRWETQAEKAKTPANKKMWEDGIKKAEAAMQRLDTSTGSSRDRGNTLFDSASQPVKDVLLSKPGDKMHTATYKDLASAIDEVQQNKIEVAVGRAEGLKDQENVRSAGEIFGIIDKFRALGEDLFTDNTFLRLSGVQGAGKILESFVQKDTRIKEYLRLREGLAGHLSRIGGERGMMTEGDIERAKNFVPDPTAFFPDSRETFLKMMGDFEDFVANKVRGKYDQRAVNALRSGSTSERQAATSAVDAVAEAKRRLGIQ